MLNNRKEDDLFWPSLTDLVLAMLLLILILWIADTNTSTHNSARILELEREVKKRSARIVELERNAIKYSGTLVTLRNELKNRPDKPLVFPLEEASGYTFASGNSQLSAKFGNLLEADIVPKILAIVEEYPIEVMEVIGHTDGMPKSGASNMDAKLTGFTFTSQSSQSIADLRPGSNADLGLARALSVAAFLMNKFANSDNERLRTLICRVYSAAQLISPNDNVVQGANREDTPARRRIELRFTRKSTPVLPVPTPSLGVVQ